MSINISSCILASNVQRDIYFLAIYKALSLELDAINTLRLLIPFLIIFTAARDRMKVLWAIINMYTNLYRVFIPESNI